MAIVFRMTLALWLVTLGVDSSIGCCPDIPEERSRATCHTYLPTLPGSVAWFWKIGHFALSLLQEVLHDRAASSGARDASTAALADARRGAAATACDAAQVGPALV